MAAPDLTSGVHASVWAHHVDDLAVRKGPAQTSAAPSGSYPDAQAALQAAADIVQNERSSMITSSPARYAPALRALYLAARGKQGEQSLDGAARVAALDDAMHGLTPAIEMVRREDPAWVEDQLTPYVTRLRANIRYIEAHDRVDRSVRVGEKEVIELPDDQHPREQGAVLHRELQKLIPTIAKINEQVIRGHHDQIHHEAEALIDGENAAELGIGSLVHLQNVLILADGWLTLTDDELRKHLDEVHGTFRGVATYSELVKAVVEFTGGALGITAAYAGIIARLSGNADGFALLSGFTKLGALKLAGLVARIEVFQGVITLLDPTATRQEKIDAGVGTASALAWLAAKKTAPIVGTAASTALMLGYGELKLWAHLFWESSLGLNTGLFREALATVQRDGNNIARAADELAKTGLLLRGESDHEKATALAHLESNLAADLGGDIDELLEDLEPRGFEPGVARVPGDWEILREVFAVLKQHKGARSVEAATVAARTALELIVWTFAHAGELVVAATMNKKLADVEKYLDNKEHAADGEKP